MSTQNVTPIPENHPWLNIPLELRILHQWAVADSKKIPHTPTEGLPNAKVNDPSTWRDFGATCHYALQHGMQIGFMLSANDPFVIIDLDVKEDTPQEVIDGYCDFIRRFNSYAEQSVSGKGFHIVALGNIGAGKRKEGVEVYSQNRFMVFTGNVVHNTPLKEQPELLAELLSTLEQTQHTDIELDTLDFESNDPQGRTTADVVQIAAI